MGKNKASDICPYCGTPAKGIGYFSLGTAKIKFYQWSCPCHEKIVEAKKQEQQEIASRSLLKQSKIYQLFLNNDFKCYHPALIPYYNALEWIRNGEQLLIYGDPGNHKTGQITAIMKKAMTEKQIRTRYTVAAELVWSKNVDDLLKVPLLVIDNFADDQFEAQRGVIFFIVDHRCYNHKATVIITNGSVDKVSAIYQKPLLDRLNCFKHICIDGPSKRTEPFGK